MSKRIKPNFKAIKTYKEYIEMFKSACKELKRTITHSELDRHDFDLPTTTWFINHCKNKNIKTYNDFLELLGYKPLKKHNKHKKYTYEIAFEEFKKKGLILLPQEYKNCALPLKYICPKHLDIIQTKSLNSLLFTGIHQGTGCHYCAVENQIGEASNFWKGGISPLNVYLRDFITEWKKDSAKNCNYKCVITGEKFDAIHHLYSFNKILDETMNICNLPIYKNINQYTDEEMELLKTELVKEHYKHPLGVCLTREIHNLYHRLYGYDNTPEQFEEFRDKYNNGELISNLLSAK